MTKTAVINFEVKGHEFLFSNEHYYVDIEIKGRRFLVNMWGSNGVFHVISWIEKSRLEQAYNKDQKDYPYKFATVMKEKDEEGIVNAISAAEQAILNTLDIDYEKYEKK